MAKNITNLGEERKKRKKRTPEEAAEAATRLLLDKTPKGLKEPKGLASGGDMSKILEEEEENEKDD